MVRTFLFLSDPDSVAHTPIGRLQTRSGPHCDSRLLHYQLSGARGQGESSKRLRWTICPCLSLESQCVAKVVLEKLGIKHGCITTIHNITNTQAGH